MNRKYIYLITIFANVEVVANKYWNLSLTYISANRFVAYLFANYLPIENHLLNTDIGISYKSLSKNYVFFHKRNTFAALF